MRVETILKKNINEMLPTISIIIPMYNTESYIKKCLNSIVGQTYQNLEIIVVDDGSTDNGKQIVKELMLKDDRISLIESPNEGVSNARNKGILIAKGKYVLFIDSDDYVDSDYVEKLVGEAISENADLVICGYILESDSHKKAVIPKSISNYTKETWAYRMAATCSRLYNMDFWITNGFQFIQEDGARGEDIPIALSSVYRATKFCVIPYAGYHYVQRKDSAMNRNKSGKVFKFPYFAFEKMYLANKEYVSNNSKEQFIIAVIKSLAMFEFVIYRKADKKEKDFFHSYIFRLMHDDWEYAVSVWKRHILRINIPLTIKGAISLFIIKHSATD